MKIKCSFCGMHRNEVTLMVTGLDAQICGDCIQEAHEILKKKNGEIDEEDDFFPVSDLIFSVKTPKDIKTYLDEYVIEQDNAKKRLSIAVYNHYMRLENSIFGPSNNDVELEKSNILMVGPTGTGKTLLVKTIAKELEVPFTIVDATVFTEAGYVGEDIESILSRLLQACNYNIETAEKGIVYIDEIDKIARKSDNPSITRDVSGEGVQQGLLKLMEGSDVQVPPHGGRKHPEQKMITINTKNILFICGGAFNGIEKIIAKKLNRQIIGFKSVEEKEQINDDLLSHVTHKDIQEFGLIPEILGRLPVLTHLNHLSKNALIRVLTEPKNALISQYKQIFKYDEKELVFDKKVLEYIADIAHAYDLGARGLRTILEEILVDYMYDAPSNKSKKVYRVTYKYAKQRIEQSNRMIKRSA